jgi:hypothetical protein
MQADNQLLHELWEYTEDGMRLCTFSYAGPLGEGCRRSLPPDAKLVWAVWAGSYFEAMTLYWHHQGWGKYTTDQAWDLEPYPPEWIAEQHTFLTAAGSSDAP